MTTKRLRYVFAIFGTVFFSAALAASLPWGNMNQIGQATLRVAIWDVYRAELFSKTTRYEEDAPFALRLTYLRDISQRALVDETRKQWQQTTDLDETTISAWAKKLKNVLPGVSKNDSITLFVDHNKAAHFYFNDQFSGRIDDAAFAQHFSGIWLAPQTTRPELRKQLLGLL